MNKKIESPSSEEEETEEEETIESEPIEETISRKKKTPLVSSGRRRERRSERQSIQRIPTPEAEDLEKPPNRKKRVVFNLTPIQHENLKKEAYEKDCTMGSIIRECVDNHFENLETVKSNPDNTETIKKIEACMKEATGFFGDFDLEEFLTYTEANELTGDIWTPELLETYLVPKLRQSSESDLPEDTNRVFEALQLDEKNRSFLAEKLGLKLDEKAEVKEKGFFKDLI
ncbi:MAG: hypothetical protein OEZ21_04090 [Candidatus Bathyarchaeota archaeon]|nr:hypothetical protein [Candidatus Bathyarchaeota archaeon]